MCTKNKYPDDAVNSERVEVDEEQPIISNADEPQDEPTRRYPDPDRNTHIRFRNLVMNCIRTEMDQIYA